MRKPLPEEDRQWLQLSEASGEDTSFVRPEEGRYTDCNHNRFLRERQDATVFHDHGREERAISQLNASLFLDVTFLVALDEEHDSMMKAKVKTPNQDCQGTELTKLMPRWTS